MIRRNCRSILETKNFASQLAKSIPAGNLIALIGNLGSGKTTFTQGFAYGLGFRGRVGSPTFKLASEYSCALHKLFHVDCYRLRNFEDFFKIGGEKYLLPISAVTLIEWADIIYDILPDETIIIKFNRSKNQSNTRIITVEGWDLGE